jgi:hypothetical protein
MRVPYGISQEVMMAKDTLADELDQADDSLLGRALNGDFPAGLDMDEIRENLEREIREHPLKTLAIAVGAGFLLAKLLD